jgi:serine/threonine-protein kinase RsbW
VTEQAYEGSSSIGVELALGTAMPIATLRTRATQERVAVARQFAAGAADAFGAGATTGEDAKLAVTEACTNAALHAYDGTPGPLQVEARLFGDRLVVAVRDAGRGGAPQHAPDEGRYGLALIEAVAEHVRVESAEASGTEVRMEFGLSPDPTPIATEAPTHAPIVRRIVSLLAAEAGFRLDRLADAVLAAETVAMHARAHVPGGLLGVALRDASSVIEMRVGPLVPGGATGLLRDAELPGVGSLVERLAQEVSIEQPNRTGDFLVVRLAGAD